MAASKKPAQDQQTMGADRPQAARPRDDGAKGAAAPTKGAVAAGTRKHSDGEQPQPAQQLDPARRLSKPADLEPETAHGHSPRIPWPENAENQAPRPFKGLK